MKTGFTAALGRVRMTDGECAALHDYAATMFNNARVRSYEDDSWDDPDFGDAEFDPRSFDTYRPNYMAVIHIGTKTFKDSYQLALTIIHEAFHGYYDYPSSPQQEIDAEATAHRCVV